MNFDEVMDLIGEWGGTMRFFPGDEAARVGIAKEICNIVSMQEQLRWLIGRLPKLFTEWPGILEVRAVFCTKFKPRDGVEAALGTGSPAFAALCPEDETVKALAAAPRARQITGQVATVSVDPEMQALMAKIANRADPLRGVKAATQADIESIKAQQNRNRTQL